MTTAAHGYGNDGPIVDVAWLVARRDDPGVTLIDPRPAHEYAASHLPGAIHLDLYRPDLKVADSSPGERSRFIAAAAAAFGEAGVAFDPTGFDSRRQPSQRVIFAEALSGTMAARGVWLLDLLGHGGGAMLDGGLRAWIEAGEELTRAVPPVVLAVFTPAPNLALLPTAEEIRDAVSGSDEASATMRILDTRAAMEHAMGTIPTAIPVDWTANLHAAGALRPADELRALYAGAGFDPDDDRPIATFCGSGYRAAHSYVVLRALGYADVRNYAPSWGEWGRRGDLPIAQPSRTFRPPR